MAIVGKDTAQLLVMSVNLAVPNTGEFTQITASTNFDDGDQESEQRPLIEYD